MTEVIFQNYFLVFRIDYVGRAWEEGDQFSGYNIVLDLIKKDGNRFVVKWMPGRNGHKVY